MHRSQWYERYGANLKPFSALTAIPFLACGLLLFFYSPSAYAQEPADMREYVGGQECAACHRDLVGFHAETAHAQALINVQANPAAMLADFSVGEDVRSLTFPGEDSPRSFTADDISYAIGSGKYAQRYLYRLDDGRYIVLPAEWNTQTGEWQPYSLSESWPDPAYDWATQCAYCHTTNLNVEQGTWSEDGVQCEACHGPGSEHLDAGEATERVLTSRERTALDASIELGLDAATCGQCHSRGTEPEHGYPFPQNYRPGDDLLDRAVFELVSERSRVHWWQTGQGAHPNMQFNEWITTDHAEAFLTVEQHPHFTSGCLTCHNVTFSRAAQIVARIEANDDRERIDILFDEADLDIDGIYQIDWETLKALTIEALELDTAMIDDSRPFLPQVLPNLIDRMRAEDELASSQILPRELAEVLFIADEGTNDDHTNQALGVTCAACHNPHSTEGYPALLVNEPEALCTGCHRSAESIYVLHHPVQQIFEGQPLIAGVQAGASNHFTAEDGPTCATCHMAQVPVESASRVSHILSPVLPAQAAEFADTCSGCHDEQGQTMQELIDQIQTDTRTRYQAVRASLNGESPDWISRAVEAIEGDGSWGIHNYAYTSAILSAAERELGLSEPVAPLILPNIPVQPQAQAEQPESQPVPTGGLTPVSIGLLILVAGILLSSAYIFLVRGRGE
jgi:predicted CXXCH cytochrome family protein